MQLSLYADYSCRVLIYLAVMTEEKTSIREISEAYGISTNHLVKVVHNLGKLGYVHTTRGRGGGISLGKPATEISIGQVIRDTESGFSLVGCFQNKDLCPITPVCGLKGILGHALREFLNVLDQYTLAEIARDSSDLRRIFQTQLLAKQNTES
ncbi:MAG: Rrf2 family transcriptional regulator [Oligoflexus sp.]